MGWTSPFQINRSLFPPPYQYDLMRTTDGIKYIKVAAAIKDSVYADLSLNTRDTTYGYRVIVYAPSGISQNNPVDTSAVAFTPRLTDEPLPNGVNLSWTARDPWTVQSSRFPWHYIYRRKAGDKDFILMDSLDIRSIDSLGFHYSDQGLISGFPLLSNTLYEYKIETQGTYGNPKIHEPLLNFSNAVLASIQKSSCTQKARSQRKPSISHCFTQNCIAPIIACLSAGLL